MKKLQTSFILLFCLALMICLFFVFLKETGQKQLRVYFSMNERSCTDFSEYVLDTVPADGEYSLRRVNEDYVLIRPNGSGSAEEINIPSEMNRRIGDLQQAFRDTTGSKGPHRITVSNGHVIYFEEPSGGSLIYSRGGRLDKNIKKQRLDRKRHRFIKLKGHWYAVRAILE